VTRPRLILLHGSVTNAALSWGSQAVLADRFELVLPNRPGFEPNPPVERVDFDADAAWLESVVRPGDHLVGHSYGGVVALLAAPHLSLGSLTVIEPPAFGVARGEPAVDEVVRRIEEHWTKGPRDPGEFLRGFLALVGSSTPPGNFTPELLQGARTLMVERSPAEAAIPLDELARTPFPKLVVSGGHSAAFEAVGDVLEKRLGAERAILPGAGHSVQRIGKPFNDPLVAFVERAEER
jgi:pimeloyl-ACP methyl ester carboxylesterase